VRWGKVYNLFYVRHCLLKADKNQAEKLFKKIKIKKIVVGRNVFFLTSLAALTLLDKKSDPCGHIL